MRILKALFIFVFIVSMVSCQSGDKPDHDESLEKYGQVFKGKIAKSYEESEEWYSVLEAEG